MNNIQGFPGGSEVKASASNAGDPGSIPGSGRSPGEGNSNPLQYSCLENPVDGGAWQATVHGVAKSRTQLNNFTSPNVPFLGETPSIYWNSLVSSLFSQLLILFLSNLCSTLQPKKSRKTSKLIIISVLVKRGANGGGEKQPTMLQSVESQRIGYDLATEQLIEILFFIGSSLLI